MQAKNDVIPTKNQDPKKRYIFKKLLGGGAFGQVSLYYDNKSKKRSCHKKNCQI